MGYGALDGGASRGPALPARRQAGFSISVLVAAAAALCCVGLLLVSREAGQRSELAGGLTSALAEELAAPGGSRKLLKREKTLLVLKPQVAAAESAVQQAVAAGEPDDNIKHLQAKAAEAKAKLEKAEAEAQHAEAALVSAAHGDASVKPGEKSPAQAGLVRDGGASRQQKGFISGDRFGSHHVYSDFGIHHNRRRGNWMQRHFGDWINTADGRPQYVCDYHDDPYETGTHRRVDVIDNEWCDDEYYGYQFPVHYHDDREVYNNGYGEHLGTVYGDNGVKPGVLHKMVEDHYGDFFHGLSPGYDWLEEHNRRSDVPAITQYAYSTYKDKTYGDEGDKRQRPLYYMDWDEDGTRALDNTKTFGEEDFMSQAGNFARKPAGAQHLMKQQLLLKKEQAEAHTLEEEVKKQKLDLEVQKLESQVAGAKKAIRQTIDKTMDKTTKLGMPRSLTRSPKERAAARNKEAAHTTEKAAVERRRAARKATQRRRHLSKHAQGNVARGHEQQLSSIGADVSVAADGRVAAVDAEREAADILDAEVGDVEASLGLTQHKPRKLAVALAAHVALNNGKALTLRQQRRMAEERRWAAEQRQEERERVRREWLKKQLAHGKGSYAENTLIRGGVMTAHGKGSYAVRAQAKPRRHKMQAKQALSLRQDRNGELAQENMGRPHGCYVQQVTGGTVMLDDCDPVRILKSEISRVAFSSKYTRPLTYENLLDKLEEKMQPAIDAARQRLASSTEGNLGGVHWTSGDVPYDYDVFPLREAHGGYSAWSDIAFPADAVYPTVYKPTLGLGPGDYAHATGTKAESSSVLKTAGAFGDEEVVNKAAVRATEASDKALKTQEMRVDKALAQQKREEAEAATDKAVADKVLADAMKNQDEEQRTRLLKAATAQYEKAAEESAKAKASAKESAKHIIAPATPATRVSEGQGVAGEGKAVKEGKDVNEVKKAVKAAEDEADKVEVSLPKALAKGSVTISFSHMRDGKVASKVAIDTQETRKKSEDALEAAHELVETEYNLRQQAKELAATEKAKTAAMVARNKELNKELATIVPELSAPSLDARIAAAVSAPQ